MPKKLIKHFVVVGLTLFAIAAGWAENSLDGERLGLEQAMQTRVEEALTKILPAGQFVVVIRVEPMPQVVKASAPEENKDQGDAFYLPGVPAVTKFDGSAEAMNNLSNHLKTGNKEGYQKFVRRISATLVLDQDLSEETVGKVRELTRQILGLDPGRGDTLDIQRNIFQKPAAPAPDSGFSKLQEGLRNYWILISLALILFSLAIFVLFIFGPIRGFMNRLVQILPTLKPADMRGRFGNDSQVLPALLAAQSLGLPAPQQSGSPAAFSGSLQVENPNKRIMPFGFIREDHLSNLAILLSRETPEKAAVVLGYLPTEWLTRVLSKIEPSLQIEITNHLATTRQLLPEQVEDIEQDLKRRLDYLIGGPDRIIAVYETLDVEGQRRMLDNLKATRPDIADELRQRTFLFEDLEKLDPSALKAVLREIDLQSLVSALKGMPETFVAKILESLPEGKAEIVKEEVELSDGKGGRTALDAQRKITLIVRRLERDGEIQVFQSSDGAPQARYGGSLRSTLKLPPALRLKEPDQPAQDAEVIEPNKGGIQDRIRRFMGRTGTDKGRFPLDAEDTLRNEGDTENKG